MGRGQGKAKGKDFDNLKQELELDVHKVQPEELFRRFNTHRENGNPLYSTFLSHIDIIWHFLLM